MLAPISWRTPPRHYGPWEMVTSLLTEALVARDVQQSLRPNETPDVFRAKRRVLLDLRRHAMLPLRCPLDASAVNLKFLSVRRKFV